MFGEIERRNERLIGFLRLLALLVLGLVFWGVGSLGNGQALVVPLFGLGLITLAGLCSSVRNYFAFLLPLELADPPLAREAAKAAAPRASAAETPTDQAERVAEGARHLSPFLGKRIRAASLS